MEGKRIGKAMNAISVFAIIGLVAVIVGLCFAAYLLYKNYQ